jgi:hypothetical protein
MTNPIWVLPEEHNYALEFWKDNRWERREQYGTKETMKMMAREWVIHPKIVRVVKVSRYDPHPAQAVVFYMEEQ